MTSRGWRVGGAAAGALALFAASPARAEPCGRPDVDATFPPHGASGVPQNAILAAHYSAPADYDEEPVKLTLGEDVDVPVVVSYDNGESMLRAVPQAPLATGTYQLVWPPLRGVATSVGLGATRSFSVGTAVDSAAPHFDGLRKASWDFSREDDPCTDSLEDRYGFELSLGEYSDDLPSSLLSVVVFETRSPKHPAGTPPTELAVLPLPSDGRVVIQRPSKEAGKVCFAAVLRDLALYTSGGGDEEACVETVEPPFFEGCSVATRGRSAPGPLALVLVALVGLGARRRRRAALGALSLGATGMLACSRAPVGDAPRGTPALASVSGFECDAGACVQRHTRLPDDGEWRCAELDGVVLCAGGEPASGVVAGPPERAFRCGQRPNGERVCVNAAPDYPPGGRERYACRFDAEQGATRACREHTTVAPVLAAIPSSAPDCWLDRDCSGRCDRGYCKEAPR
ncbi:MAG TPA: Ig-like domain-containing protein [Polyangiaceae bacterium]|nr:Ig-like domain-containing protein [Polyangiaceae bacterium]